MSAVPAARPTDKKPRRGGSGSNVALSRNGRRALTVFFIAFLIFLYVPTVLLIVFSFNDSTVAAFPLAGLTMKWYRAAFSDPCDTRGLRRPCGIYGNLGAYLLSGPGSFNFDF